MRRVRNRNFTEILIGWDQDGTVLLIQLKVIKFQILLFSFEPKNEWNIFLISALANKKGQINEMKVLYYINYGVLKIEAFGFFYLTHFRSIGQKSKNIFVLFWFKSVSEIDWPFLAGETPSLLNYVHE